MKFSPLVRASVLAISAMTLAACSSTSDDASGTSAATTSEAQQGQGVETGAADRILTPAEQRAQEREEKRQRYADLRQERVIYFDFDNASIRGEFAEILAAHADYLVRNPSMTVVIEGHTDERGTPEYNIALGERRAKSVVDYLQSLGVSAGQMTMVSYGEEKPVVRQSNERAWAQNRRAVLVY
ncbi:peptidoglycan-associated lipoprotein [Aliidiomarina taiwanensis]|uniref:Peptidoglycan-associated lipoprotein n=1 Tax=Aliidiomarina taiwanensis TaxID=946228 RepID=A0A432X0D3_9GAMM|nr:peptidoglycan-associated lipoprotein Pal [Aliidiomarina taiwanensis]RUO39392.1 peptidoglycan-associated lipoprotein [Aliidiomarina taiwanensis]